MSCRYVSFDRWCYAFDQSSWTPVVSLSTRESNGRNRWQFRCVKPFLVWKKLLLISKLIKTWYNLIWFCFIFKLLIVSICVVILLSHALRGCIRPCCLPALLMSWWGWTILSIYLSRISILLGWNLVKHRKLHVFQRGLLISHSQPFDDIGQNSLTSHFGTILSCYLRRFLLRLRRRVRTLNVVLSCY